MFVFCTWNVKKKFFQNEADLESKERQHSRPNLEIQRIQNRNRSSQPRRKIFITVLPAKRSTSTGPAQILESSRYTFVNPSLNIQMKERVLGDHSWIWKLMQIDSNTYLESSKIFFVSLRLRGTSKEILVELKMFLMQREIE